MNILLALLLLLLAALARPAHAQSFDCAKAGTEIEKLICDSEYLKVQDNDLAKLYTDRLATLAGDARKDLVDDERSWLRTRAMACGSKADPTAPHLVKEKEPIDQASHAPLQVGSDAELCLEDFYSDRITALKAMATADEGAIPFPARRYPFLPTLIQSNDPTICPMFEQAVRRDYERRHFWDANSVPRGGIWRFGPLPLPGAIWMPWAPLKPSEAGKLYAVDLAGGKDRATLMLRRGAGDQYTDLFEVFL